MRRARTDGPSVVSSTGLSDIRSVVSPILLCCASIIGLSSFVKILMPISSSLLLTPGPHVGSRAPSTRNNERGRRFRSQEMCGRNREAVLHRFADTGHPDVEEEGARRIPAHDVA